jgi:ABC-type lipoprotein release transport system permease subunit
MAGVTIGTMALVVVLSVLNGFENLVQDSFSAFDPSLKITPKEGKYFSSKNPIIKKAKSLNLHDVWCEIVEQDGLIAYNNQQAPAKIKGVDYNYNSIINSETIMWDGSMDFENSYNNQNLAAIGFGLAEQINSSVNLLQPLTLYAPKNRKVNLARPDANFTLTSFYNNGIFCVMQPKYDDNFVIMPIDAVRNAYQLSNDYVTAIEIKCNKEKINSIKNQLKKIIASDFIILDQYEQQADFYRITKIEKWTTFMILCFIIMIATFNIIGSLSMIIIEKKNDITLFNFLGATTKQTQHIFTLEGTLISSLGVIIGSIIGIAIVLLQEHFGLIEIKTNHSSQIYPVELQLLDIVIIISTVLIMGFLSSLFTAKKQIK